MRTLLVASLLALAVALPARAIDIPGVAITVVHDGDTLDPPPLEVFPDELHRTSVRARGINAPEINSTNTCEKAAAEDAKAYLLGWLSGHTVTLRNVTWYKFGGEIVATIVRDDGRDYATDAIAAHKVVAYSRDEKRVLWPPCQTPPGAVP